MKPNENTPGWMKGLADITKEALDAARIEDNNRAAAIFIAVERTADETQKHVIFDIRGDGLPLAEAIGTLVFSDDLPEILPDAAGKALALRKKQEAALVSRALKDHNNNHKNHKNQD